MINVIDQQTLMCANILSHKEGKSLEKVLFCTDLP